MTIPMRITSVISSIPGSSGHTLKRFGAMWPILALVMLIFPFTSAWALVSSEPLLEVTLQDAVLGTPLPDTQITAYELQGDGSLKWRRSGYTDDNGQLSIELEGLESGSTYRLQAKNPFGTGDVYSRDFSNLNEFIFPVGMLRVKLLSGINSTKMTPMAETRVYLRQKQADGSYKWYRYGTTDAKGIARFDADGLAPMADGAAAAAMVAETVPPGDGKMTYVYMVKSPVDGHYKYSREFSQEGTIEFTVGEVLTVTLVDGLAQETGLPAVTLTAYERLADDSLKSRSQVTTDDKGQAVFDLDGLGAGRTYVLRAKNPFGTGDAYSKDIGDIGGFVFPVGMLKVKLLSGINSTKMTPMAETRVYLRQKQADGSYKWYRYGTTDAKGIARFDADGLAPVGDAAAMAMMSSESIAPTNGEKTYVYMVKSPVDGHYKYSEEFSQEGTIEFTVGEVLTVTLVDGLAQETGLPAVTLTAYERLADDSLKSRSQVTTDDKGQAVFDLDGLNSGRTYVLRAKNPFGTGDAYSKDVKEAGGFKFAVGMLEVQLISGINKTPMAETRVYLRQKQADGSYKWYRYGTTDTNGIARFDAEGLTPIGDAAAMAMMSSESIAPTNGEKTYVYMVKSPVDGHYKYSEEFSREGEIEFTVGEVVEVTLKNATTDTALPERTLIAYELLQDRTLKWVRSGVTDAAGKLFFDLDGLGNGRTYQFRAKQPFESGDVYSEEITAKGTFGFLVGTVSVILVNGDNNQPMPGHLLTAYEKLADGKLKWSRQGTTGEGGIQFFDLPGLGEGRTYTFRVRDAFGNGRTCYSPLIREKGRLIFPVKPKGDCSLDLTPPTVAFTVPVDGQSVSHLGFAVTGVAIDDRSIQEVTLTVAGTAKSTTIPADYDADSQTWSAQVTADMVSLGDTATLTARALDRGANEAVAFSSVLIVEDNEPPEISDLSHSDGDPVAETGFLLSGTVTDNTGVGRLVVTVYDPGQDLVTVDRDLAVAPISGNWSVAVQKEHMTVNQTITVTLTAADTLGNESTVALQLDVVPVDFEVRHLINRITFGATPDLLEHAESLGPEDFLAEQLDPDSIPDSEFQDYISSFPEPATKPELKVYALRHMIYSQRQLKEVMTWFWENHFSTDVDKARLADDENEQAVGEARAVFYEFSEHDLFRANALGNFRTLLGISAKSPAMLYYLDGVDNVFEDSNENYAREIMELHTMGVDGGYIAQDIEAAAEIFTGWQVKNEVFFFEASQHNPAGQQFSAAFSNLVIEAVQPPQTGIEQGDLLLDVLAGHRSTAEFICTKLVTLFVSDQPVQSLVPRCADTFQAAVSDPDQIGQVVESIVSAPEFAAHYRGKIKTPVELTVGLVRHLAAEPEYDLPNAVQSMGINLFENPLPTGWSEIGADWINTNLLLERVKWVNQIAFNSAGGGDTSIDPKAYFSGYGYETAEGIVDFIMDLSFGDDFTDLEYDTALGVLDADEGFNFEAPNADDKLRQMLGTIMSYPGYNYQ